MLTSSEHTKDTYTKKSVKIDLGEGIIKIEWKGSKCLPDHVKYATRMKKPPRIEPQDTWESATCKSGLILFHNTKKKAHAISIATDGIKKVKNLWGGGALGQGFYTHQSAKGAKLYGQGRFTLKFQVTSSLKGKVVPRYVSGHGIDKHGGNYAKGNDFLTSEDDRKEFKFHSGKGLKIVSIYDYKTKIEYDGLTKFINAILGG